MRLGKSKRHYLRWIWRTTAVVLILVAILTVYPVWQSMKSRHTDTDYRITASGQEWRVPKLARDDRRILLLMIDGLSVPAYEKALADGRLPNLQRLMASRPTSAMSAVSTFPSATSPSVQEMLSGRYAELDYLASPGAVHAFDRKDRRIIRYVTEPDSWQWPLPTVFDAVKGQPAVTVFEGRWDGPTAILTQYNMASQAILAALGASALSTGDAGPVDIYLDIVRSEQPPVVSLVVLNEFDMEAHFYGPLSAEAQRALGDCDALLGKILQSMEHIKTHAGRNLLEQTTILFFGDHGMIRSGRFVNLPKFLADQHIKAMDVSTIPHVIFRERLGRLWTQWPDAILVAGGSNVTQVYLRRTSGGWTDNEPVTEGEAKRGARIPAVGTLIEALRQLEGIDQVMHSDTDGSIHIYNGSSEATVVERSVQGERRFAYLVDPGAVADPLGYLEDEIAADLVCRNPTPGDGCFHDALSWIDRTYHSRYPAAVPLVPKAFSPARFAGDLIVTARTGYSFLRNQQGDHGNLDRDAMLTPLVLNGPGVHECEESHVPRLVDMYPTVSVLLGARPDDPALRTLDGRVLDCVREPMDPTPVE